MRLSCALVAQLDRASGYEPEGRGFDSLPARHYVEHARNDRRAEEVSRFLLHPIGEMAEWSKALPC